MFGTPVGVIDDPHCFDASHSKRPDYRVFGEGKVGEAMALLTAISIPAPFHPRLRPLARLHTQDGYANNFEMIETRTAWSLRVGTRRVCAAAPSGSAAQTS